MLYNRGNENNCRQFQFIAIILTSSSLVIILTGLPACGVRPYATVMACNELAKGEDDVLSMPIYTCVVH